MYEPGPQVLYVSKNSLRSLAGVEQFPRLRVLSAMDNCIEDYALLGLLKVRRHAAGGGGAARARAAAQKDDPLSPVSLNAP